MRVRVCLFVSSVMFSSVAMRHDALPETVDISGEMRKSLKNTKGHF